MLLERDHEVQALAALIAAAGAGEGGVVTIEGEAGIGKTSLLDRAATLGRESGCRVLRARATALEADFGFGVVRLLFERAVARADAGERERLLTGAADLARAVVEPAQVGDVPTDRAAFAVEHGLYWLCCNLADERPLLLVVDDAHWGDVPSLRWLAYVARRLDDLPVALVVAWRTGEPDSPDELLDALRVEDVRRRLLPRPLSADAAIDLVVREAGTLPDAVAQACHDAAGGNPFLLHSLAGLIRRRPELASPERIREVGPEEVQRSVVTRLARLGADATALARSVAVLDIDAAPRLAFGLAGVSPDEGTRALADLERAQLVVTDGALRFVHPLVRTAVYDDLPAEVRARQHRRAAELLVEDGEHDRAGAHLLATRPDGDPWVIDVLREGARRARGRGALEAGLKLLERALAEPPSAEDRPALLLEAGRIALALARRDARAYLTEAHESATDPKVRAGAAAELARAVFHTRPAESVALLRATIDELDTTDREGRDRLLVELLTIESSTAATRPDMSVEHEIRRLLDSSPTGSAPRQAAAALLIWFLEYWGEHVDAASVSALARELTDVRPLLAVHGSGFGPLAWSASVLAEWGHVDVGDTMLRQCRDHALRTGDHFGILLATSTWANHQTWCGSLAQAEESAHEALTSATITGSWAGRRGALMGLTWALTALGRFDEADEALRTHGLDGKVGTSPLLDGNLLLARAALRSRQGRHAEAHADVARILEMLVVANPGNRIHAWVPRFLPGSVHEERAVPMAEAAISWARAAGAVEIEGIALHSLGLVLPADDAIPVLTDAVAVLARSAFRWELAEALVDLGAIVRRSNRRIESRTPLNEGLALASEMGAAALGERARQELLATGARPRASTGGTGLEALTASERRVAQLAARGCTIPEVAQTLFVSRKTVETHLYAAYRKLDVRTRTELRDALGEPSG